MPSSIKCVALGLEPSFGFGDRTGLATPGHVAAMKQAGSGIQAIFPQQSIREMTRTGRTANDVMQDALLGVEQSGWTGPVGADADHLKTEADVDITAEQGFTFFTIDPSDHVDQKADDYDEPTLAEKFEAVRSEIPWVNDYTGKTITLSTGSNVELTEIVIHRAAVKYGKAIAYGIQLANYIKKVCDGRGQEHEIELSVDETDQPTTLAEHYIIADQCLRSGMKLVSLAPRFIGNFEKGVDYKGDLDALERSLLDHNAVAETLGPYKLSLHSGSDKLSIYSMFARTSKGRFHVKTAGTSYLEAVRVAAKHDADLFKAIINFSRDRYETDKATYHLSATLDGVAPPEELANTQEMEDVYLEMWDNVPEGKGFTNPGRQILHCTFGSVLTDDKLGGELKALLQEHQGTYDEVLREHFVRHLEALQAGM